MIHTDRLDLYLIKDSELFALGSESTQEQALNERLFANPHNVLTGEKPPHHNRIADVIAHPDNLKWYYRLIVERSSNILVGSTSFHAPPDSNGMLEIGIGIAQPCRNRGFATEALHGMWTWASKQEGVEVLRYTVSPDNLPSMKIISNFGFSFVGTQDDPEDGLENIYEQNAQQFA
ncbi:MAG: GNAT family N-acetyltransferase [Actinobacteria bacterium]|nr:GNAT family N-acetyltransferase [Actinomycetota bacterium]